MGDHFVLGNAGTGFEYEHGVYRLAPFVTGDADHGGLGHGGMAGDGVFHFSAEDVLAAADDHVLEAVADIDEAVLVHIAAIAGVHPAATQRFGGGLRLVPVAEHDVRPAHEDFAHGAARHFAVLGIADTDFYAADR
ncbi:hypothetical protein D9M71_722660 [compost metagenome]